MCLSSWALRDLGPKRHQGLHHHLLGPYFSWWLGSWKHGLSSKKIQLQFSFTQGSKQCWLKVKATCIPAKKKRAFGSHLAPQQLHSELHKIEARQHQWGFGDGARGPRVPAKAWASQLRTLGCFFLGYQPHTSPRASEAAQEGLLTQNKCYIGRKVQHRSQTSRHISCTGNMLASTLVSSVSQAITWGVQ